MVTSSGMFQTLQHNVAQPLEPMQFQLAFNLLTLLHVNIRSGDNSVRIATGYELDGSGSIPGGGKRILFCFTASRKVLGPTQWVQWALSPRIKRQGA